VRTKRFADFDACKQAPGAYSYHGYIGNTGVGVIDEDQFDFEVTEALALPGPEDCPTTEDQDFVE
jgi:hypothetical protein